jgi:hypothetical protein
MGRGGSFRYRARIRAGRIHVCPPLIKLIEAFARCQHRQLGIAAVAVADLWAGRRRSGGWLPSASTAEAIRKAADAYNRTRLTPTIQSLLRCWLAW